MQIQNTGRLRPRFGAIAGLFAAGTILAGAGIAAQAPRASQTPQGEAFATPEMAADALVNAAKAHDVQAVTKVLGPQALAVLTSPDAAADRQMRDAFLEKAKEKTRVVPDPEQPKQRILEVGNDNWPFPVPIVHTAAGWRFDLEQGKTRIALVRIGNNELNAINMARGYVEAQNEYYKMDPMGTGVHQYAQQFMSTEGKRNGLYWKSESGREESPIGGVVAKAIAEGHSSPTQPYHGYHFKILKAQGPNASGGAMDYVKDGAMTGGFALIAWPADYQQTGVMTFMVDRSGIVYEKDLGPQTSTIAPGITAYNPDATWKPVSGSGAPKRPPARTTSRSRTTE